MMMMMEGRMEGERRKRSSKAEPTAAPRDKGGERTYGISDEAPAVHSCSYAPLRP